MTTLSAYAGLGSIDAPPEVEAVMRGIGRVFSGSKILRTCGSIGDAPFQDGARIGGGRIELYQPEHAQTWAIDAALRLEKNISAFPERQRQRIAARIAVVLGVDGAQPVEELITWLGTNWRPGHVAANAAREREIPVHDLALSEVFATWKSWVEEHAPTYPKPVQA